MDGVGGRRKRWGKTLQLNTVPDIPEFNYGVREGGELLQLGNLVSVVNESVTRPKNEVLHQRAAENPPMK